MSTVAKVMGRALIKKITAGTDTELRREKAGFRKERSKIEQIFVLRNFVQQVVEGNVTVNLCFVDDEKTFDSIRRDTL